MLNSKAFYRTSFSELALVCDVHLRECGCMCAMACMWRSKDTLWCQSPSSILFEVACLLFAFICIGLADPPASGVS